MKLIIDRFEGEYAVLEMPDRSSVNIPRLLVPNAHEGDVVEITADPAETAKNKDRIQELHSKLFED